MGLPNPREAADKWGRNMAQATESIRAGVSRTTVAPTAKAAAQADHWQRRVTESGTKDKFKRNLERVTLEDWKRATIDRGIPRIQAGAAAGKGKQEQFFAEFFPHLQAGVDRLPARGTLEENLNRANEMARHNAAFKRSR